MAVDRRPRCPICRQPTQPETRPFCSPRCARIDLGRWLSGDYAVPDETPPEAEEDDAER